MIHLITKLNVADNTGAKRVNCIKVIGGSHRKVASVGDVIVVSIRSAKPRGKVKKGDVHRAVVVRVKKEYRRKDGTHIKFSENAVVLIDKQNEPLGTGVFGPVPRELRARNFMKIISLAPEVV